MQHRRGYVLRLQVAYVIAQAALMPSSGQEPPQALVDPPLDPNAFAPTSRASGLLYPNPEQPTCEVLLNVKTLNTTGSQNQQPTSSPVATSVQSAISLQIENLNSTAFENGFNIIVELPLDTILTSVTGASVGPPSPGSNGTTAFQITSALLLPANGSGSQILNATVTSNTQDCAPRQVFLNGTRCALAFEELNPTNLPTVGAPLFANVQTGR